MGPVRVSNDLRCFDEVLACAERITALISRTRPVNAAAARASVVEVLRGREGAVTPFRYAGVPALGSCMKALDAVAEHAGRVGPIGSLYRARARELGLEARMLSTLGTPVFRKLAAERFRCAAADAAWADPQADTWARSDVVSGRTVPSDDASDPRSLVRCVQREVGRARLPVRVIVADLDAHAATGDGVIYVGRGRRHSVAASERIALHEVSAHAAPRARAASEALGLFRFGTAGASEDEEGRALLIERRAGYFDDSRRRELGLRHVAARTVLDDADVVETARVVTDFGAGLVEAADLACRVHRGGGLAREIAYLPALRRVERSLSEDPALERWLRRGRLSLGAARLMADLCRVSTSSRQSALCAPTPETLPFG